MLYPINDLLRCTAILRQKIEAHKKVLEHLEQAFLRISLSIEDVGLCTVCGGEIDLCGCIEAKEKAFLDTFNKN